jgi:hypothetical protein
MSDVNGRLITEEEAVQAAKVLVAFLATSPFHSTEARNFRDLLRGESLSPNQNLLVWAEALQKDLELFR